MSSEHHNTGHTGGQPPTHADVSFEPKDVETGTILAYMFYLAVTVIAALIISVFVFRLTTKIAVQSDTAPPPVRQGVAPTMPPEPRLQGVPGHTTDPQLDLRNKRTEDEEANEKLGWIDKQAGIAQIPVD